MAFFAYQPLTFANWEAVVSGLNKQQEFISSGNKLDKENALAQQTKSYLNTNNVFGTFFDPSLSQYLKAPTRQGQVNISSDGLTTFVTQQGHRDDGFTLMRKDLESGDFGFLEGKQIVNMVKMAISAMAEGSRNIISGSKPIAKIGLYDMAFPVIPKNGAAQKFINQLKGGIDMDKMAQYLWSFGVSHNVGPFTEESMKQVIAGAKQPGGITNDDVVAEHDRFFQGERLRAGVAEKIRIARSIPAINTERGRISSIRTAQRVAQQFQKRVNGFKTQLRPNNRFTE